MTVSEAPEPQRGTEEPLEGSRMTLGEHLAELRVRLIRSVVAVVVAFALCWAFHEELGQIALRPQALARDWLNTELVEEHERQLREDPTLLRTDFFLSDDPEDQRLREPVLMPRGDSAMSGLVFYLKISLYFALFLSGTYILWQIWQFIAAGLYKHERKLVGRYFPFSAGLFLGGVVFGYFVMVPYAVYFGANFSIAQIRYDPKLEDYFGFLKSLSLALGLVFQLPVFMFALARLGLVEPVFFRKHRGHFVLLILVLAAVLTPPDPFTQMMMAVPMYILYELGVVLARVGKRQADATPPDAVA